jgi:hypothetical protein
MLCISYIHKRKKKNRKDEAHGRGAAFEWKRLLVECYVGGQVFGDGVQLTGCVAEVPVPPLAEFPVLRLVVPHAPNSKNNERLQQQEHEHFILRHETYFWASTGPDFMQPT